jgi:phosphoserine phosphatase
MELVVTLIANPAQANLTQQHVDHVQTALSEANCVSSSPSWLAQNIACDISFEGEDIVTLRNKLQNDVSNFEIDSVIQPMAHRRKHLLLADMDSTIVIGEVSRDCRAEKPRGSDNRTRDAG